MTLKSDGMPKMYWLNQQPITNPTCMPIKRILSPRPVFHVFTVGYRDEIKRPPKVSMNGDSGEVMREGSNNRSILVIGDVTISNEQISPHNTSRNVCMPLYIRLRQ